MVTPQQDNGGCFAIGYFLMKKKTCYLFYKNYLCNYYFSMKHISLVCLHNYHTFGDCII